jgi:small subunit ribosomal protein S21
MSSDRFLTILRGKEVIPLASVHLRNGESQDSLLRRFRKKIVKSGILSTIRDKRWFVSKSETRRMDKKKAIRRSNKKRSLKENE